MCVKILHNPLEENSIFLSHSEKLSVVPETGVHLKHRMQYAIGEGPNSGFLLQKPTLTVVPYALY